MGNIYADIPADLPQEFLETLAKGSDLRIERIVSRGHATPGDDWYEQDREEFVLLLRGSAVLEFEDGREAPLEPGDWLVIPAHSRHRVAKTDPQDDSIWLCVHYRCASRE